MVAMGNGRGQRMHYMIGGDRDGHIKALYLKLIQDAGAYPYVGAILPTLTRLMASGVYAIPQIEVRFDTVVTNTTPTDALRGAGRPEAAQVLERAVDEFARDAGLDPAEVRRRNFIAKDDFPYTTKSGATYDVGDYALVLDEALRVAGYDDLRAEQARRRESGDSKLLGIGMSVYVEITNGAPESEFGAVEITPEGDAILKTGSFSHGQGHETTFAQIASNQLGIPVERITVVKGDTDRVARGTGTYGSKSTQIGGAAARQASEELVEKAKELAAEQLEAAAQDVVLELGAGEFHVAGSPTPSLSWGQLAKALGDAGRLGELSVETDFTPPSPTFPFGSHIVVVEIDSETGSVDLQRVIAVDDAGTIINPMIADGQIHGGVAAGLAQALFEELAYDEDGNPQNANFVTYCIPSAMEFPQFEIVRTETPTPVNPLGAKGIGESGTIGATPAAINAVIDALSHLGVRTIEMPANGERCGGRSRRRPESHERERRCGPRVRSATARRAARGCPCLQPGTPRRYRRGVPDRTGAPGHDRPLGPGRRLGRRRRRGTARADDLAGAPHADARPALPATGRALPADHLRHRPGPDVGRATD
jgi:carbon-monoxide dehydrogenase large subunit